MKKAVQSFLFTLVLTLCAQAAVIKTNVYDVLTNSGTPLKGTVTFFLVAADTTAVYSPNGLIVKGASITVALNSAGRYDVALWPSASLSPESYYVAYYAAPNTVSRTFLGLYSIPVVVTTTPRLISPYLVTDANKNLRFVFASELSVQSLGGGTAAVTSVFGRTGAVVAAANDYTFAQIGSKPTTLSGYGITDAAAVSHTHILSDLAQSGATTNQVPQWNGLAWVPATVSGGGGSVTSVFGRTGAVVAAANDYTFAQLASKPTTLAGYGIADAAPVTGGNVLNLNSQRTIYVPDQTNFTGTLYIGNGGTTLSHATGTEGQYNLLMGFGAGLLMTGGSYNVGMGAQALFNCSTCNNNVGMGTTGLYGVTTGYSNTAVGSNAGSAISTGIGNTILGSQSGGGLTTGTYNTILGANISGLTAALNQTVIVADGLGNARFRADTTGATIFGLVKVQSSGVIEYASVTFAALPAGTNNGSMIYCSNCTIAATCATGGTGAFAKRINSAWVCN